MNGSRFIKCKVSYEIKRPNILKRIIAPKCQWLQQKGNIQQMTFHTCNKKIHAINFLYFFFFLILLLLLLLLFFHGTYITFIKHFWRRKEKKQLLQLLPAGKFFVYTFWRNQSYGIRNTTFEFRLLGRISAILTYLYSQLIHGTWYEAMSSRNATIWWYLSATCPFSEAYSWSKNGAYYVNR